MIIRGADDFSFPSFDKRLRTDTFIIDVDLLFCAHAHMSMPFVDVFRLLLVFLCRRKMNSPVSLISLKI